MTTIAELEWELDNVKREHQRQLAEQRAEIDQLTAQLTYARADRDGWSALYRKVREAADAGGGKS